MSNARPPTIPVVDDDHFVLTARSCILAGANYHVLTAAFAIDFLPEAVRP